MSKDTTELKSNAYAENLSTVVYCSWYEGPHYLKIAQPDNKLITHLSKYLKFRFITTLYLKNSRVTQEMINAILSSPVHTLTIDGGTFKTEVINSLQKLTELCIREYKIPDHIIPQFRMPSLSLYKCELGPEEAKLFLNMPWLKSLDLGSNPVGDEGAKTLASLITLEELRLSDCNITPDGVKVFLKNKTLTTLDLSHNPVGYEGLLVLLSLSNLINLTLELCEIKIELSKSTRYTINQNLKTLNLSHNSLKNQEMMSLLTYCPALTQADFKYNMQPSAIDLNTIVKFQNLKILKLDCIALTDENVLDLSNHPFITELSLSRCGLSPTGLGYLSKNPVLEKLNLTNNTKLQGDTVNKHFSNFPALTHLILNHCSISDKAISSIAKNPRLQKLRFTNNSIILSWGIIALALNANISELTFDYDGIPDIYLLFFLGNRALDYLNILDYSKRNGNKLGISDSLFERNPMLKKQQDKTEKEILSSCLSFFPQVLIPIIQDYTREYSYSFQLFHNRLSKEEKRQWNSVLPEIEKNLPEITKFLK